MKENYHTHTWRCNHATGTEEAYIQSGIARGLSVLGFSDHSPYIFPGSHYSTFRMTLDQFPGYVQTLSALREVYRDSIQLYIGLETEFYPRLFPELLAILREYPLDYMILGQHFTCNEIDGVYSGRPTSDPKDLQNYCAQVMDAMQTGLFTYVAHPDLLHFVGDRKFYRQQMRQLCRESRSTGVPLELNFLGLRTNRHYPGRDFLELVAEEGCPMIFGCDAHSPQELSDTDVEVQAEALLKEYGIALLPTVPLRTIH